MIILDRTIGALLMTTIGFMVAGMVIAPMVSGGQLYLSRSGEMPWHRPRRKERRFVMGRAYFKTFEVAEWFMINCETVSSGAFISVLEIPGKGYRVTWF